MAECDIRNKTYNQLPEELRDRFDQYQIETVIHQDCNTMEISKFVRKYNNHQSMTKSQKAFTYVDVFAKEIRDITKNRFFLDVYTTSQKGRINGTLERVVGEMVLLCNYPDKYRKDTKTGFKWLNENATIYDFECINNLLTRLTDSVEITKESQAVFNSKHTFIFVAAFKSFTELGRKDEEFGKFLEWFVNGGNETEINGKSWKEWDSDRSTRDSGVVHGKLDYLVLLMSQYSEEVKKAA